MSEITPETLKRARDNFQCNYPGFCGTVWYADSEEDARYIKAHIAGCYDKIVIVDLSGGIIEYK